MKYALRGCWAASALLVCLLIGGCPTDTAPLEFVAGGTGDATVLRDDASIEVLTPASSLSIAGGTQIEANWRAFAASRFSIITIIVDEDQDPDNDNEILAYTNLPLSQTSALIDTTRLAQGTYFIGALIEEVGEIVAFDYAPGAISIDQRPELFFTSPRDSFEFDRTLRITPRFDVAWELEDPDSTNTVTIYLDPNETPDGDEILLYTSDSQVGGSFSFDLPTSAFEPGTYRLLAVVGDSDIETAIYAPGTIQLNARLAGYIDLRDIDQPQTVEYEGAVFEGFNPRDNAGSFVNSVGDIDLDGFDDIIILAQFAKPNYETNLQRSGTGEAYMIYGRQERFRGVFNLNSTATLVRGEIFQGVSEAADPIRPSRGISSFDVIGDWDADGVRELAFGIPFTDSVVDARTPACSVNFRLDNEGAFRTGGVVIAAGSALEPSAGFPGGHIFMIQDFGQVPWNPIQTPECCHSFYGPNNPGSGGCTLMYRYLADANCTEEQARLGCRIHTHDFGDQCGETVGWYPNNAILISVPNRDPVVNTPVGQSVPGAGCMSLYYGGHLWRAYDDGGATLPHDGPYRYILDDTRLFLAPSNDLRRATPGYFVDPDNQADPCTREISGVTPVPGRTMRVYGGFPGAAIGNAVTVGDFSADGLFDIAIGSPLSNDGAGSCFIVFGRLQGLMIGSDLAIEELGLPMNSEDPLGERIFDGVRIVGEPGERLGFSQAPAGDFNADGIDDVLIGSALVNDRRGGAAVFFGSRTIINLTETEIRYNDIPTRGLGVLFSGVEEGDLAGARVASAGDIDRDGNDDILIAAPNASVRLDLDLDGTAEIDRTNCGVVYLIYGSPDYSGTISLADVGTERLPGAVFIGRDTGDFLGAGLGLMGDRSYGIATAGDVDGDGFGDLMFGSVSAAPRDRAQAGETYLIYGIGNPQ